MQERKGMSPFDKIWYGTIVTWMGLTCTATSYGCLEAQREAQEIIRAQHPDLALRLGGSIDVAAIALLLSCLASSVSTLVVASGVVDASRKAIQHIKEQPGIGPMERPNGPLAPPRWIDGELVNTRGTNSTLQTEPAELPLTDAQKLDAALNEHLALGDQV
jgi:hypothetical protein